MKEQVSSGGGILTSVTWTSIRSLELDKFVPIPIIFRKPMFSLLFLLGIAVILCFKTGKVIIYNILLSFQVWTKFSWKDCWVWTQKLYKNHIEIHRHTFENLATWLGSPTSCRRQQRPLSELWKKNSKPWFV